MYCKKCGAELKEGQKFCTKCGTPVSSASNTEAKSAGPGNADPGATKDVTPKKTNTKVIAGIIAAVAVVAVIIIVVATRSGGSEEQIAETELGPEQIEETELDPEQIEETAQSEYEDEYAEDEESGLTAGEQEQLRQQEIIDNIDLDLTVKRGKYYSDISKAIDALDPDPDVLYKYPEEYDPEDLYYVSGTITNNNDEDYCFYLQYNIEETYTDNYGDQHTEEIEPQRSNNEVWVAAHDTVPYYDKWSKSFSGYKYEVVSYVCTGVEVYLGDTGTVSTTPREYGGYVDGKLLPISEVSDLRFATEVDEYGYVIHYMAFTITNNTDDRWLMVAVDFYVLLNGEYMERYTFEGEYIKPGETVQIEDDIGLPDEMYNPDGSVVDEIEIQVCGVVYVPDTSE